MPVKVMRSLLFSMLTLYLITACSSEPEPANTVKSASDNNLAAPSESGVLKVATRNGSTTYYLDRHENPAGPEYALLKDYASSRGWEVEWVMYDSTAAVINALEDNAVHLAAAGLTHNKLRDEKFTWGGAHTEVTEQLVSSR